MPFNVSLCQLTSMPAFIYDLTSRCRDARALRWCVFMYCKWDMIFLTTVHCLINLVAGTFCLCYFNFSITALLLYWSMASAQSYLSSLQSALELVLKKATHILYCYTTIIYYTITHILYYYYSYYLGFMFICILLICLYLVHHSIHSFQSFQTGFTFCQHFVSQYGLAWPKRAGGGSGNST